MAPSAPTASAAHFTLSVARQDGSARVRRSSTSHSSRRVLRARFCKQQVGILVERARGSQQEEGQGDGAQQQGWHRAATSPGATHSGWCRQLTHEQGTAWCTALCPTGSGLTPGSDALKTTNLSSCSLSQDGDLLKPHMIDGSRTQPVTHASHVGHRLLLAVRAASRQAHLDDADQSLADAECTCRVRDLERLPLWPPS